MTKRSHSDFSKEMSEGNSSKRLKIPDAVSLLSDNSDDLIECLQALKHQKSTKTEIDLTLSQRITTLSQQLLPAFTTLANGNTQTTRGEPSSTSQRELPLLTPWNASEISHEMPPLPPILDPIMEKAAFTHPGRTTRRGDLHYERLEWIGDAYIYLISCGFIYQTFKTSPPGKLTQIRELLVRNETLKDFSLHYGFHERLVFPVEYTANGRLNGTKASEKERTKVLGDVFEAYVAAVILSDLVGGVTRASSWLKSLWSMTIASQIKKEARQTSQAPLLAPLIQPLASSSAASASTSTPTATAQAPLAAQSFDVPAKDRLSAELVAPGVRIEYKEVEAPRKDPNTKQMLFTLGCFITGYGETVQLGKGVAQRKAEAGHQAAEAALKNKKMMKIFKEKKRLLLENRKVLEEAAKRLDY